ncbi:Peptidoglycan/xylan/chitin deacetylase, PgdA/CDA1 family [Flavobacteriaceae bacterium MAR_2010_188]|nr:Peptidoglycan/xylan/chitin deacetylase, PgdA/CDA1 family [Flavobacteriaceae bacterium MAR_2010_188]
MNIISAKTPELAKYILPNYIWDIKTDKKELYLTFDDGPTEDITAWVLDILNEYSAKATFFCIGKNIAKHPEIFESILAENHAIGNHTLNHKNGWQTNIEDYLIEVEKCQEMIKKLSSNKTQLFRPPYGKITLSQSKRLRGLGYKIVMWDVLSFDWQANLEAENCYTNVKQNAAPGSIIVFHDSIKAANNMKYVLPKTLKYFSEKGYTFKALP